MVDRWTFTLAADRLLSYTVTGMSTKFVEDLIGPHRSCESWKSMYTGVAAGTGSTVSNASRQWGQVKVKNCRRR